MVKLETFSNRVLEPLCKATKTILEPLNVMPNDYLLVGVDKEMKRFVVKIVTMTSPTGSDGERKVRCPDGEIRVTDRWQPSYSARVKFIQRIPERKEILVKGQSTNKWVIAGTDFTVLVIHHAWPKNQVIFGKQAKTLYTGILMRFMAQSMSANLIARFKVDGFVPEMPDDFMDHPDPDRVLAPYQKIGLLVSLNQPGYGLFMEQGTGKTPVTVARVNLEGYRKRRDENKMYRVLIVCPKQTRKNWSKEFERFSVRPGKISILRGGQETRNRHLADGTVEESDCCWAANIVSWDSIPSMWDFIKLIPWDLVVYDEEHYGKNPSSRRFKYLRKYAQYPHIRQRMGLTGTPIANTVMDLWALWELLGEGLSGFMSYKNFRSFIGKFKKVDLAEGGSIQKLIRVKNIPLIQERLSRTTFIITKKEANLQLPEKLYDYAEVDMTVKQAKLYKIIAAQLVHEIENDLETKRMSTEHILTKLLRLAQITSGHLTWDKIIDPETLGESGGGVEQIDSINPKVNYIVDEVSDSERDPNGKMLIWMCFIEDLRVVSEALAKANINHVGYHDAIVKIHRVKEPEDAEEVINNDDSCRVFLGNPASAGTGLNFLGYDRDNPDDSEMYVDREIFMSCNWSYIFRSQGEDRAHRRGIRSPSLRITDLIVPDTIDEEIRERLMSKKKMALEIQDLKQILRKLL